MLPQTDYIIQALKVLGDGKSLNKSKIEKVIDLLSDALAEDAEA